MELGQPGGEPVDDIDRACRQDCSYVILSLLEIDYFYAITTAINWFHAP